MEKSERVFHAGRSEIYLDQITSIIEKEAPDAVLICGDIYDKPVPPSDAVRVLDGFLTSLAQKKVPVFLISGNHDSAERLAFGSQLMMESQVIFSPVYDGEPVKYCMKDEYGEVWIHLLPFLKPAVVRHVFPEEEITSYQDAVSCAVKHMQIDPTKRNVLLAHQFVTGAARCDSEEVSVGGVDQIAAETFQEFDYTALGHIHSPQNFKMENAILRNTTEIFFFRVWTEKVSDGCGTERKRNNRDPGDRSFTAPGSEEYQGELSGSFFQGIL